MKRILLAAALLLPLGSQAAAFSAEDGTAKLIGTWASFSPQETWIFTPEGKWQQYNGGKEYASTYSVAGMPALLLSVTSSVGHRYVLHFYDNVDGKERIAVFREGETEAMTQMYKVE